jgi:hypothetical protein
MKGKKLHGIDALLEDQKLYGVTKRERQLFDHMELYGLKERYFMSNDTWSSWSTHKFCLTAGKYWGAHGPDKCDRTEEVRVNIGEESCLVTIDARADDYSNGDLTKQINETTNGCVDFESFKLEEIIFMLFGGRFESSEIGKRFERMTLFCAGMPAQKKSDILAMANASCRGSFDMQGYVFGRKEEIGNRLVYPISYAYLQDSVFDY